MRKIKSALTPLARALRKSGNNTADRLWHFLRNRQMDGHKFRREFPIGPYIADFACLERHLVVELDGSQHEDDPRDAIRNDYMTCQGWSVARFANAAPEPIVETIAQILAGEISEEIVAPDFQFYPARAEPMTNAQAPHPNPLPTCGEREHEGGEREVTFMQRAIALTRPGTTWPNPSVGCVIVRDGEVVGEGTTGQGGRPHAEELALAMAGENARGATAFVTLEPCGKRSTGAPSCSQRLVEAGVARVVFACADPSPYASHVGVERMREAGIIVEHGVLADEARYLIAPTAYFHATGRPLVRQSETDAGFDAEFVSESADLTAELAAWASRGYRDLYVKPVSDLARRLRELGYLSE